MLYLPQHLSFELAPTSGLKQTGSLTPCHLSDLVGCYCSQLQGLSSSCNHLWQSASVRSPSVPPTSFPSALRGLELLTLSFNPPALCLASLRPPRPLQRWLEKSNNWERSGAEHVSMQTDSEWIHILCVHMPFVWSLSSEWAGLWEAQCCPMAVSGSLCGSSDLRYIIKSAHSFSLSPRWLWGLRPRLTGAEPGSLWSTAQPRGAAQNTADADQRIQPPEPCYILHGKKHFIQYISTPSVSMKDSCCLIYRSNAVFIQFELCYVWDED